MPKQISHYICQNCGFELAKWQGKCPNCNSWNSLIETFIDSKIKNPISKNSVGEIIKPIKLKEIKNRALKRIKSGIAELDRVLGGGIVNGSLVLIAGEPGIGKSTLLIQLALNLAFFQKEKFKILYVCGEESPEQIKLRIERLKPLTQAKDKIENIFFLAENNIENILASISKKTDYDLIIIDSIQTLWSENIAGSQASVAQVKECSQILLSFAKKTGIPVFLIGHVNKEGLIAGPKVLEHLVDTVLYLEGDSQHQLRLLRAYKNRFGPVDEVGVFQMTDKGMEQVKDIAQVFIGLQKRKEAKSGSALTVLMQGLRPMLAEIQALVVPSQLAMPRRVAEGISFPKLQVICAILQKHLRLPLHQTDIFVNVVGGLKIQEPCADLAIALAIYSSFKNKPLSSKTVCLGELGLLGEIRKTSFWEKRIKEAKRLGYNFILGEKESYLYQAAAAVGN